MFILKENKIAGLTLSGGIYNASFPRENMQNQHPKKVARSTTNVLTVTATNALGIMDILLLNTNAVSGTILITNNADASEILNITISFAETASYENYYMGIAYKKTSHYEALAQAYGDVTITVTLTSAVGTYCELGLFIGGYAQRYGTTLLNNEDSPKDSSIEHETANGSIVKIPRHVAMNKVFNILATTNEIIRFYSDLVRYNGNKMVFIPTRTAMDYKEHYTKYGICQIPKGKQIFPTRHKYTLNIKEIS